MTIAKGIAIAALAGATAFAAPAAAQDRNGDPIANQYICTFNAGVVSRGRVRVAAEGAARPTGGRVLRVYRNSIRGFLVYNSPQGIARMQARNPGIETCVPDRVVKLAPPFSSPPGGGGGGGGGGGPSSDTIDWGVQRVYKALGDATFKPAAYTGSNRAWIIDTGIDLDHLDLNVSKTANVSYISKGKDTSPNDSNGHGSHVSGTIGAKLNGSGVAGVAPGVEVVSVRVLDQRGSGSYSDVIAGVDYVACMAASGDVANMSLGGPVNDVLNAVVKAASTANISTGATDDTTGRMCVTGSKNVYFAIAAGNESTDASTKSPASASTSHIDNVFVVSAIDQSDTMTYFSNYGEIVDVGEPGYQIYSTYKDGGYATLSGTSMAAPHMAGILLIKGTGFNTDGVIKSGGYDKDNTLEPIAVAN